MLRLGLVLIAMVVAFPARAFPTGDYAFDIQLAGETYAGTFHNDELDRRTLISLSLPGAYTFTPVVLDIVHPTPWPENRDAFPVFAYSFSDIRLNYDEAGNSDGTGQLLVRWDFYVGTEYAHINGTCPAEVELPDCPKESFQGSIWPPMGADDSYQHYFMTGIRPVPEPSLGALVAAAIALLAMKRRRLPLAESLGAK
jgi:hypothetical protein